MFAILKLNNNFLKKIELNYKAVIICQSYRRHQSEFYIEEL